MEVHASAEVCGPTEVVVVSSWEVFHSLLCGRGDSSLLYQDEIVCNDARQGKRKERLHVVDFVE